MRLLFVTEFYPVAGATFTGGVEARAHHVTRELAERHEVTVVTSWRGDEPRTLSEDGVRVIRVGPAFPYSNTGYLMKRLRWAVAALRAARRLDADLVEGTSFVAYMPAGLTGIARSIPRTATYHECWLGGAWTRNKGRWTGLLGSVWERLALRLPWTRIISVSEHTKQILLEAGVPDELVDVVPNGIDPALFSFGVEKDELPTIACVSRLIPTKRVDVLICAIPAVARAVPDVQVNLVGAGSEAEALKRLAAELGVADRIRFFGRVDSNEEVRRIIKRSHVFALPTALEGFGIVVLEAMAAGVPVACSDIPPLREVTAGRGALLSPPGDSDGLGENLTTLLTDEAVHAEKEREAMDRVRSFTWEEVTGAIEEVYEAVAERSTGERARTSRAISRR